MSTNRERSERRNAGREVAETQEEIDFAVEGAVLRFERLLMNIPLACLSTGQAEYLRFVLRRLGTSGSESAAGFGRFIAAISERLLPSTDASAPAPGDNGPAYTDLVDTSIDTLIRSLADNGEETLTIESLAGLQEERRIRHGQRPYRRRHKRVAAICRLVKRLPASSIHEPACSICHEDFLPESDGDAAERPVVLPCEHVLGQVCAQTWFAKNTTCPICRRNYSEELFNGQNSRSVLGRESVTFLEDYAEGVARSEAAQDELDTARAQAANNSPADHVADGQAGEPGRELGIEFELAIGSTDLEGRAFIVLGPAARDHTLAGIQRSLGVAYVSISTMIAQELADGNTNGNTEIPD